MNVGGAFTDVKKTCSKELLKCEVKTGKDLLEFVGNCDDKNVLKKIFKDAKYDEKIGQDEELLKSVGNDKEFKDLLTEHMSLLTESKKAIEEKIETLEEKENSEKESKKGETEREVAEESDEIELSEEDADERGTLLDRILKAQMRHITANTTAILYMLNIRPVPEMLKHLDKNREVSDEMQKIGAVVRIFSGRDRELEELAHIMTDTVFKLTDTLDRYLERYYAKQQEKGAEKSEEAEKGDIAKKAIADTGENKDTRSKDTKKNGWELSPEEQKRVQIGQQEVASKFRGNKETGAREEANDKRIKEV